MASDNKALVASEFRLCDKEHFRIVKGIAIVAMVVTYLYGLLYHFPLQSYITGTAGVVFLFCSGYGLSESYNNKRGLIHYWENKMMGIWVPSLVVMLAVSLIAKRNALIWIEESPLGLKGNFLYMLFGAYVAFWAIFRFIENKTAKICCLFVTAAVAFCFLESRSLAAQIFAFPVGTMFSQLGLKYKIRSLTWKGRLVLTLLLLVGSAAAWVVALRYSGIPYAGILLCFLAFLTTALLMIFGVFFAQKIKVFNYFALFGEISFGIYLLYEDVFALLNGKKDIKIALVTLVLLIAAASLFTWLRFLLITWNKNMRRRKKTHLKGSMW